MKKSILILFLLLITTQATAASYTWPSNVQPQIGDLAQSADGQFYEITDACTYNPTSANLSTSTVFGLGGVPCHDLVSPGTGTLEFRASGIMSVTTCKYTEFFTCPAIITDAQDIPLDWAKVISFMLGGMTGIAFVMASSIRW